MTPNQLQDNAAALLDLYARAEEEMLRKVARRLSRGIDETGWAERKYGEIRQLQQEIRRSLEHLARQSSELRNALVENAFETGEAAFRDEYRALGGFLRAIPESRFNAVATLTNELSERFEAAHSAILRDVDDNYRRIIGAAVSMQATGTITTREAVKSALNSFAEKGIIGFVDKAGRHWNMDSYAEMAVRTGMMRAMREGYRQDALAHGEELVIISEHEDTCPMCVDWERAVLALTDAGALHPEAEGTLAEAEAAGLFHPNCGHSMTVYVPGLTDKSSRKREALGYSRAEDMMGYENRQQQRYMERQVRAWKRRQAVATTPEDERYAKAYVDKWQRALRAYTGETKLPRKYTREGGRVKLSDAARKMKALQINENGSIIKNSRNLKWLRSGYDAAVKRGDLSALTGFEHYVKVAQQVERDLVGKVTKDGVTVAGYKTHFLDRIIGSYEQKREPVSIESVLDALTNPDGMKTTIRGRKVGRVYTGGKCKVTMNPSGELIQTTPKERGK